jgi:hypothetical protein
MSTTTLTGTPARINTKQKVGLVLCILYSLTNIPSVLEAPSQGQTGPPMSILVVGTILGVVGVVAGIMAWRGNRLAMRIAAGAIIIVTLTGLPAFFVDVPMWIKALVGVAVVVNVVTVVLMFSGDRRDATVLD